MSGETLGCRDASNMPNTPRMLATNCTLSSWTENPASQGVFPLAAIVLCSTERKRSHSIFPLLDCVYLNTVFSKSQKRFMQFAVHVSSSQIRAALCSGAARNLLLDEFVIEPQDEWGERCPSPHPPTGPGCYTAKYHWIHDRTLKLGPPSVIIWPARMEDSKDRFQQLLDTKTPFDPAFPEAKNRNLKINARTPQHAARFLSL